MPTRTKKAVLKDIDKNKYHLGLFRDSVVKGVFDFMFGYGELQKYVDDEDISDIDGTSWDEFSIKKNGKRMKIPIDFGSSRDFDTYCKLLAVIYARIKKIK